MLDVRVIIDSNQHITDCLNSAREPKQIFVTNLPLYYDKRDVSVMFDQFGKITDMTIMNNKEKKANIGIVTFLKSSSAKRAITAKKIKIEGHGVIFINYAQPKFSKYMLVKIHPSLRRYIKSVSRGEKTYDPAEFLNLQEDVLKNNESLQCLEKNKTFNKKFQKKADATHSDPETKNFFKGKNFSQIQNKNLEEFDYTKAVEYQQDSNFLTKANENDH